MYAGPCAKVRDAPLCVVLDQESMPLRFFRLVVLRIRFFVIGRDVFLVFVHRLLRPPYFARGAERLVCLFALYLVEDRR